MPRREAGIVWILLAALFVPLWVVQSCLWFERQSDTAFVAELAENIARRGAAVSQVAAGTLAFTDGNLPVRRAEEICASPLPAPPAAEFPILSRHTYFILYAAAPLTFLLPAQWLWPALHVGGFLAILAAVYFFLRRGGIGPAGSAAFVLLVAAHPAWSESLFGQIYVERLFAPLVLVLLFSLSEDPLPRWRIAVLSILCVSLVERTGVLCGVFLAGYAALFGRRIAPRDRRFVAAVGVGCFLFSAAVIKLAVRHGAYGTFLPAGPADVLHRFSRADFRGHAIVFLIVNCFLLVFAAFEWRGLLLALAMLAPNLLGDIGGAEKTGWATHYHSLYFPFLVWAAAVGFLRLARLAPGRAGRIALTAATGVLALAIAALPAGDLARVGFSLARLREQAFWKTWQFLPTCTGRGRASREATFDRVRRAVAEGSRVTMPESLMPLLYRNRSLYLFPVGLDAADHAILRFHRDRWGTVRYSTADSYLGNDNATRLNECLVERMARDGFDFDAPVFIDQLGIAVVARRGK